MISNRIFQSTAIFTPPRTELLGKRRLQEDTDDSTDESVYLADRPIKRASKRVRFADTDDLPISHVRTHVHQLVCIYWWCQSMLH